MEGLSLIRENVFMGVRCSVGGSFNLKSYLHSSIHKFLIGFDKVIPIEDQDSRLFDVLSSEEELSGIFNWSPSGS
jgi:hypothetical protein